MDMSKVSKKEQLELKKMMKEWDYLLTEEEYKNEIIDEYKVDFLKRVGIIEPETPVSDPVLEIEELKEEEKKEEEEEAEPVDDGISEYIKKKVKKLYREIVKVAHPDKTDSEEHLSFYIDAKKASVEFDLIALYDICENMKIPYSIEIEDKDILRAKIDLKKERLKKIECSFIWLYAEAKTDEERNELVEKFREHFGSK
jgi:hypothetical protein